jgi:hypothetical protein
MRRSILLFLFLALSSVQPARMLAQVTTGGMSGIVSDAEGKALPGVRVVATHEPSGTKYGAITNSSGRYNLAGLRTGRPYSAKFSSIGLKEQAFSDIAVTLGNAYLLDVRMKSADVQLQEITVSAKKSSVLNEQRTGAATNVGTQVLETMPTLNRSIADFTRTDPRANGLSFGGQDRRYINFTVDGSSYNNNFGLSDLPGGQTNSTPISLDAIEEIQVNMAPYDVRQAGFTGAGINAITRKGDNQVRGSVFYNQRSGNLLGTSTSGGDLPAAARQFNVQQFGGRLGGPIIENKLFFFINGEYEARTDPGTTNRASTGDAAADAASNTVRRGINLTDSLNRLKNFLIQNFQYDPGVFQEYNLQTWSAKATARLDYNIDEGQRVSLRYNFLRSYREIGVSSTILGNAIGIIRTGRSNLNAMNFSSSNYIQNNDLNSIVAEYNGSFGSDWFVNVIAGYTQNRDYRALPAGRSFPLVDIAVGGLIATTFGDEPFTPNNRLDTDTWQFQANVTRYLGDHVITVGTNIEAYSYFNVFTPQISSVYQFNSFTDFYQAVAGQNVRLASYNNWFSAVSGTPAPAALSNAVQAGIYAQDEWNATERFKLTLGVRGDYVVIGQTAPFNPQVATLRFNNLQGNPESFSTSQLPTPKFLISPRIGFNWDVNGDRTTQIRGGVGIFTGRIPFVVISNQVGNTGMFNGAFTLGNTTVLNTSVLPGTTTPIRWSPLTAAGQNPNIPADATSRVPPVSYEVNMTSPNFQYPQVLRSNLAIDQELPLGIVATLEGIYTQNINQVFYRNANLPLSPGAFTGRDNRPRFPGSFQTGNSVLPGITRADSANRLNPNLSAAYILDNTNAGNSLQATIQLQRAFDFGLSLMAAYTYSATTDLGDYGSTLGGTIGGLSNTRGYNFTDLAFSSQDITNRFIANISYRINWADIGAPSVIGKTSISLFLAAQNQNRLSYIYANDLNGDGFNSDLLFVPADQSQIAFLPLTIGAGTSARTFDANAQWTALNNYISQDPYLSSRRGQYSERNGFLRAILTRIDLSIAHDFVLDLGKPTGLQVRFDIFNFTNLLNKAWGVSDVVALTNPLTYAGATTDGRPQYRVVGGLVDADSGTLSLPATLRSGNGIGDVWQAQLGFRITFN